jgi:hypothetical protein
MTMISRVALLLLLASVLVGCGGGDKGEGAVEKPCPAAPAALASDPKLPPGFPSPSKVTYTDELEAGPSVIVKGYWDGDIDAAYEGYKDAFDGSGYSVTKDEKEAEDAEVNFAGRGVSGQVKLLEPCKDRTDVAITIRPSS